MKESEFGKSLRKFCIKRSKLLGVHVDVEEYLNQCPTINSKWLSMPYYSMNEMLALIQGYDPEKSKNDLCFYAYPDKDPNYLANVAVEKKKEFLPYEVKWKLNATKCELQKDFEYSFYNPIIKNACDLLLETFKGKVSVSNKVFFKFVREFEEKYPGSLSHLLTDKEECAKSKSIPCKRTFFQKLAKDILKDAIVHDIKMDAPLLIKGIGFCLKIEIIRKVEKYTEGRVIKGTSYDNIYKIIKGIASDGLRGNSSGSNKSNNISIEERLKQIVSSEKYDSYRNKLNA